MIVPIPVAARVPPTVAVTVTVAVVVTVRKHLITLMHPLQSHLSAHIYDILTHDHIMYQYVYISHMIYVIMHVIDDQYICHLHSLLYILPHPVVKLTYLGLNQRC